MCFVVFDDLGRWAGQHREDFTDLGLRFGVEGIPMLRLLGRLRGEGIREAKIWKEGGREDRGLVHLPACGEDGCVAGEDLTIRESHRFGGE